MPRPFRWDWCLVSSGFASYPGQFEAIAQKQKRRGPGMLGGQRNGGVVNYCRAGYCNCWGLESQFTPMPVQHCRTAGEWWCSFTPQIGPSRRQAGENCWWDSHWAGACSPDHGGTVSEGHGDTSRPCAISRARRVTWSGRAGGSLGSAVCPLLVKKILAGCEREAAPPSHRFDAAANPARRSTTRLAQRQASGAPVVNRYKRAEMTREYIHSYSKTVTAVTSFLLWRA